MGGGGGEVLKRLKKHKVAAEPEEPEQEEKEIEAKGKKAAKVKVRHLCSLLPSLCLIPSSPR